MFTQCKEKGKFQMLTTTKRLIFNSKWQIKKYIYTSCLKVKSHSYWEGNRIENVSDRILSKQ